MYFYFTTRALVLLTHPIILATLIITHTCGWTDLFRHRWWCATMCVHEAGYLYTLKTESGHDANFVVDDDKVGTMTTIGFQGIHQTRRVRGVCGDALLCLRGFIIRWRRIRRYIGRGWGGGFGRVALLQGINLGGILTLVCGRNFRTISTFGCVRSRVALLRGRTLIGGGGVLRLVHRVGWTSVILRLHRLRWTAINLRLHRLGWTAINLRLHRLRWTTINLRIHRLRWTTINLRLHRLRWTAINLRLCGLRWTVVNMGSAIWGTKANASITPLKIKKIDRKRRATFRKGFGVEMRGHTQLSKCHWRLPNMQHTKDIQHVSNHKSWDLICRTVIHLRWNEFVQTNKMCWSRENLLFTKVLSWRHGTEKFSSLLVLCEGNPAMTNGLLSQWDSKADTCCFCLW